MLKYLRSTFIFGRLTPFTFGIVCGVAPCSGLLEWWRRFSSQARARSPCL